MESEEKVIDNKNIVGYFIYNNAAAADAANKEQEKIMKLEEKIDYNNPKLVYALYCKIINEKIFKTPEGILYLVHLEDFLHENEDVITGEIPAIPFDDFIDGYEASNFDEERAKLKEKIRALESAKSKGYRNLKIEKSKTDNAIYKIIIAAMAIVIVFMIIISSLSSSPTILNYKQKIENEYADWEQKLSDKEKELNQRERQLNMDQTNEDSE